MVAPFVGPFNWGVRLEVGAESRDRYRRLLAHVYTEGGLYVNAELLRQGCAKLMVLGANVSL